MDKPRVNTEFKQDMETYGPIGEKVLYSLLKNSKKTLNIEDVSDDERFRLFDIDLIQFKSNDLTRDNIVNSLRKNQQINRDWATTYEVKTDTYGYKSRNIVYEVFSNGRVGCLSRSQAHYLFYVFIDNNSNPIEEYLIDLSVLRKWMMENMDKLNKVYYYRSKYMNHEKDKTGIILINVDFLVENKLCIKIL